MNLAMKLIKRVDFYFVHFRAKMAEKFSLQSFKLFGFLRVRKPGRLIYCVSLGSSHGSKCGTDHNTHTPRWSSMTPA